MGLMTEIKQSASIEEVALRLGMMVVHERGKVMAVCPSHDDHHPTMELNTSGKYQGRFICRACPKDPGEGDVVDLVKRVLNLTDDSRHSADVRAALWIKGEDRRAPIAPPREQKVYDAPTLNEDLTAFAFQAHVELTDKARFWLMRRGLGPVIETFSLGSTDAAGFPESLLPDYYAADRNRVVKHTNFRNRVVIPYIGVGPDVAYVNARALDDRKPKYLKAQTPHKSAETPPYLLEAILAEGADDIWLCEGELDCLSLYAARPDIHACAIPGVATLHDKYLPMFSGRRVWIVMDNDNPGMAARKDLERRLLPFARCLHHVFLPDDVNDLNQMLVKHGRRYVAGYWEACVRKAVRRTVFRPF